MKYEDGSTKYKAELSFVEASKGAECEDRRRKYEAGYAVLGVCHTELACPEPKRRVEVLKKT